MPLSVLFHWIVRSSVLSFHYYSSWRQHLLPGKTFEEGSFLAADKPRDPRSGSVKPGEQLLRRSCTLSAFLCTTCSAQLMYDWRSFSTSLSKKKGQIIIPKINKVICISPTWYFAHKLTINWLLDWNDQFKQHLYSQNTALNYIRYSSGFSHIFAYSTWCRFFKSTCTQALGSWDLRSWKTTHLKISQSRLSCCRKYQEVDT